MPPIRHICDFSRGALNVRSTRSHPTLAPRPQICLIGGNGFCAVAGEGELNRGDIWGQKLMSSAYSKMTGNRGDDLADGVIYLILRLFEGLGYGGYDLTTYRYRDKKMTF